MRTQVKKLACTAVLCVAPVLPAQAESYADSPIPGWQAVIFEGLTQYSQQDDCVLAVSRGGASGLIRAPEAPLAQAPVLRWSWKVETPLKPGSPAPEKVKGGDDFVTRVYVIHKGFFPWQTKAINYVWSREHAVGASWPNPFTSNAMMVVVQSGPEGLGEWQTFERDVRQDFRDFFDMEVDRVDAVAVMTDTDNSQGEAQACYRLPSLVAP